jgi:hypothetical protein
MSIETEPTAGKSIANEASASARKKTAAAKPNGEKLICRYCGSDDLAPSFRKRGDRRCRACFKQRYGSAARNQKAARTRKVKAAK